ncbi:MAG: hypothetical protein OXP69_06365 [Spirochaetaceae bacterium]|nr:hypothetical protein [Spirochaetaceae bacterium]
MKRIDMAARQLTKAWRSGARIPDLSDARPRSRREAYAVQDAVTELLGLPVVGWKVGAATPAIMKQRGLDAPIPGPLFGPRVYAGGAALPAADFPAANLETEFAIRTLAELPPRRAAYEAADLAAVSELLAAFDLTQSRYSAAPDSLAEIADSGNSGGAVIGTQVPDWRDRDLTITAVDVRVDGGAPVPTYRGAWRRHPLDVFAWLVNSLGRRGIGLPAGSVILTGSLTEPHPVVPGSSAVARFDGGAEVRMCIAATRWRGVLIAESLHDDPGIWDLVMVTGRSGRRLEREGSRGEFTFCNVEVADEDVDSLLRRVAARLRSPGWYFHLERDRVIKVAYPGRVMEMNADAPATIPAARDYGVSIGIHPEQLRFERFMGNPYDQ